MRNDEWHDKWRLFENGERKKEFVDYVLKGGDLSETNSRGETVFHYVCNRLEGQEPVGVYGISCSMIDFLLAHGADANAQTNKGLTPLFYALYQGDCFPLPAQLIVQTSVENLNKLYDDGDYLDEKPYGGKTIFTKLSLTHVRIEDVKNLVAAGADINKPDAQEKTILSEFCHKPCYGLVEKHIAYLKTLLELGAKMTPKESYRFVDYVLHLTSNDIQVLYLKELMAADALDLTGTDVFGNTHLHRYATHFDRGVNRQQYNKEISTSILKHLLEKINIDTPNHAGETPLNAAIKVIPYVLAMHGGYEKDFERGPYFRRSYVSRERQIHELIQSGANVHLADNSGHTPYHNAWKTEQPYYAKILTAYDKTVENDTISPQAQNILTGFNHLSPLEQTIIRDRLAIRTR